MESENVKIVVTGETKELVIRTGEAPVIKEQKFLALKGDINAPVEFAAKRKTEINALKSHVEVDKTNFKITLVIDEENHYSASVEGALVLFPELAKLKINENKIYSPRELYDTIKFMAAWFKNRDQHKALCEKLTKFTSRVETDFTNSNDFKGNVALSKLTKIKTDLDLSFILAIPIFKGSDPATFSVEICLDTKDGGVILWLESVELHELKTKESEVAMKSSIDALSEYVTINI